MSFDKKVFALAIAAFLAGVALPAMVIWNPADWGWANRLTGRVSPGAEESPAGRKQLWTCGMHTQVIQDKPGNCPICGMRLVPVRDTSEPMTPGADRSSHDHGSSATERKILYWRAPMDPTYISDQPGKSPMGMDLVPVYEEEAPMESGIRVDPSFLQNFGVRTAVVERGSIPIDIRTVGIIMHNEKNLVSVSTKFEGWIEKAYYNNIGQHVHKGSVLFEIYSPQLVTTQQEYLASLDYSDKLSTSNYPDAAGRARSLVEATRERLRYWDVSEEAIRELETTRQAKRTVKVYAPISGHLTWKAVDSLEGAMLTPGMTILKLADHTKLWVEIELYEDQIRHAAVGTQVRIEVEAFPGRTWTGRIVYFHHSLDPQTRTLTAHVEVENKDLKLRPQMYANISIRPRAVAGAVKVPAQAILHTGQRNIVIVQKARGLFEPREVQLGASGGDFEEVRSGLQAGEVIVTSSQFLIDSESNLKAAIQQLLGDRSRPQNGGEPAQPPMTHQH